MSQYTLHHQILLVTENDLIKYLLEKSSLVGKLAKWQVLLLEFDIKSSSQKSVKGRAIATMLVENSQSNTNSEVDEFDNRILALVNDKWTMYFDGATNLSESGTGAALISPEGQYNPVSAKLVFHAPITLLNTKRAFSTYN